MNIPNGQPDIYWGKSPYTRESLLHKNNLQLFNSKAAIRIENISECTVKEGKALSNKRNDAKLLDEYKVENRVVENGFFINAYRGLRNAEGMLLSSIVLGNFLGGWLFSSTHLVFRDIVAGCVVYGACILVTPLLYGLKEACKYWCKGEVSLGEKRVTKMKEKIESTFQSREDLLVEHKNLLIELQREQPKTGTLTGPACGVYQRRLKELEKTGAAIDEDGAKRKVVKSSKINSLIKKSEEVLETLRSYQLTLYKQAVNLVCYRTDLERLRQIRETQILRTLDPDLVISGEG